jgi:hypothetical protein
MPCYIFPGPSYHRSHPCSMLLGSGYTSDYTGDGPPPPLTSWPSSPRLGFAPSWNPIYIDFRLLNCVKAHDLVIQFHWACLLLSTKHPAGVIDHWCEMLQYCQRFDLHDAIMRYKTNCGLTTRDLRSLVYTSMDDLLFSWRGHDNPSLYSNHLSYLQYTAYIEFVDSLGPFGDESWITVHASLFWWFNTDFAILYSHSSTLFLKWWNRMTKLRQRFVSRIQNLIPASVDVQQHKESFTQKRTLLRSILYPALTFTRNHPSWRAPPRPPLMIVVPNVCCRFIVLTTVSIHRPHPSSILLGSGYTSDETGDGPPPPPTSCQTFLSFGGSSIWNPIRIEFSRFEGFTIRNLIFMFRKRFNERYFSYPDFLGTWESILSHCNRPDLLSAYQRYYARDSFTMLDLKLLVYTSMDDLVHSWRDLWKGSTPPQGPCSKYHQYFTFLESLGRSRSFP